MVTLVIRLLIALVCAVREIVNLGVALFGQPFSVWSVALHMAGLVLSMMFGLGFIKVLGFMGGKIPQPGPSIN
jgi:hypothetical protein